MMIKCKKQLSLDVLAMLLVNKFWYNIKKKDKSLGSLNFEALEHWKELPTEEALLYGVSD